MKYSRKIRQPKKAKKVTLQRIREIVREEFEDFQHLCESPPYLQVPRLREMLTANKPIDGGREIVAPFIYEQPSKAQSSVVSPPPLVSARYKDKNLSKNLPDGFQAETEELE